MPCDSSVCLSVWVHHRGWNQFGLVIKEHKLYTHNEHAYIITSFTQIIMIQTLVGNISMLCPHFYEGKQLS